MNPLVVFIFYICIQLEGGYLPQVTASINLIWWLPSIQLLLHVVLGHIFFICVNLWLGAKLYITKKKITWLFFNTSLYIYLHHGFHFHFSLIIQIIPRDLKYFLLHLLHRNCFQVVFFLLVVKIMRSNLKFFLINHLTLFVGNGFPDDFFSLKMLTWNFKLFV